MVKYQNIENKADILKDLSEALKDPSMFLKFNKETKIILLS
jgi:hypothetical protein